MAYVFLFIWLDGYMWSLIIGFVHIPLIEQYQGDLTELRFPIFGQLFLSNDHDADYWMAKHDSTIIAMISVNQIAGLVAENAVPVVLAWILHRGLTRHRRDLAFKRARALSRRSHDNTVKGAVMEAAALRVAEEAARKHSSGELWLAEQRALEEWWLAPYSTQDDYYDVRASFLLARILAPRAAERLARVFTHPRASFCSLCNAAAGCVVHRLHRHLLCDLAAYPAHVLGEQPH